MADKRITDFIEAASAGADYYLVTDSLTDGVKKIKPSNIVPAYTGDVTSAAGGTINTIADNAVTNAKAAQMAAGTIKSNITGALASASDNTIAAVMDAAFGATQGAVAFRDATGWTSLAPGTSGQFFQTSGPAANPIWQTIPGGGNMLSTNYLSELSSNTALARTNIAAAPDSILAPATSAIAMPTVLNLQQRERHIGEWGVTFNYLNDGLVSMSATNTTRMQNALNSGEHRIRVPGLVPIESELVMAHQCVLIGDQMRASGFVGVGMADNAATIRIQPLSTDSDEKNKRGWSVQEMAFLLHGGQNQGYVPIVVDTTGGIASRFLSNMHLGRLYIPEDHIPLGSDGTVSPRLTILHQNDTTNGGMFVSRIVDSYLGAGIQLVATGDSIDIRHNTITGYGVALQASLYTGAARLIFDRNNCTTRGGAILMNGGEQLVCTNNQIEQQAAYEGSYAAQIVLRSHLGAEIAQNNVSTLSYDTLDNIALLEGSEDNHIDRNTLGAQVFTGGRVHVRSDGSANNWIGAHNTTYDSAVPRTRSRMFVSSSISWRELHYDWLDCALLAGGGPWAADDTSASVGFYRGLQATRVGREVRLKGCIKPGLIAVGTQVAGLPNGDFSPVEARRIAITAIADGVLTRAFVQVNTSGVLSLGQLPSFSTSLLLQFDGANYEL